MRRKKHRIKKERKGKIIETKKNKINPFTPPAPKNNLAILQENGARATSPYLRNRRECAEDNIAHSGNFVNAFPIVLTTLSCARNEF